MRRFLLLSAFAASTAAAQTIAITGGTVFPVSGPKIDGGTVVITNGRITAVGKNVAIPAGAERIDATGKWVTPGFINGATSLGLSDAGSPQFSGGYNDTRATGTKGMAASFNAWEGINPASVLFAPARQEGVTSAFVGLMAAYLCKTYGLAFYPAAALIGIAGYMGGLALQIMSMAMESRLRSMIDRLLGKAD